MRIDLGRRADYAVRATVHLARRAGSGRSKAHEIAADMEIPESYLPAVMSTLVRAGLVTSTAGPDGGYELSRSPVEVSLLEVIEAIDGPIEASECVLRGGPCRWEDHCAVHVPWAEAQGSLRDRLAAASLAEIAAEDAALARTSDAAPE